MRSPKAINLWECHYVSGMVPKGREYVVIISEDHMAYDSLEPHRTLRKYACLFQNGQPDTSFFAPDCILPNQKFHTQLSRALWANMVR